MDVGINAESGCYWREPCEDGIVSSKPFYTTGMEMFFEKVPMVQNMDFHLNCQWKPKKILASQKKILLVRTFVQVRRKFFWSKEILPTQKKS